MLSLCHKKDGVAYFKLRRHSAVTSLMADRPRVHLDDTVAIVSKTTDILSPENFHSVSIYVESAFEYWTLAALSQQWRPYENYALASEFWNRFCMHRWLRVRIPLGFFSSKSFFKYFPTHVKLALGIKG